MRKTILKITLGGALAITAAMGVQMASSTKTVSNLIMQNTEALADGESSSGGYNNAKSIYCAIPAGKIGCTSQVARYCYESVFCTK